VGKFLLQLNSELVPTHALFTPPIKLVWILVGLLRNTNLNGKEYSAFNKTTTKLIYHLYQRILFYHPLLNLFYRSWEGVGWFFCTNWENLLSIKQMTHLTKHTIETSQIVLILRIPIMWCPVWQNICWRTDPRRSCVTLCVEPLTYGSPLNSWYKIYEYRSINVKETIHRTTSFLLLCSDYSLVL